MGLCFIDWTAVINQPLQSRCLAADMHWPLHRITTSPGIPGPPPGRWRSREVRGWWSGVCKGVSHAPAPGGQWLPDRGTVGDEVA